MPIYDYECEELLCGQNRFTLVRPMAESDRRGECPQCHHTCPKVPSLSNFVLTGGGWAKDGYSSG